MPSRNLWDMTDFPLEFELFQEYAGMGQWKVMGQFVRVAQYTLEGQHKKSWFGICSSKWGVDSCWHF